MNFGKENLLTDDIQVKSEKKKEKCIPVGSGPWPPGTITPLPDHTPSLVRKMGPDKNRHHTLREQNDTQVQKHYPPATLIVMRIGVFILLHGFE